MNLLNKMIVKIKNNPSKAVVFCLLCLFSLMLLFPFWWMLSTSFDRAATVNMPFPPRIWPEKFSTKAYTVVMDNIPIIKYMLNTLAVIVGIIFAGVSSALLAGYAFSKLRFKGYGVFLIMTLSVLMIPQEVIMVPQYMLFSAVGLTDTYWALWLPGICYVFGTFFVKQYFDTIPDSIREAAMIDGASEFRTFVSVFMPLCGTAVATLSVLLFLYGWNDLLWPLLVLSSKEKFTMQIGIAFASTTVSTGGSGKVLPAVNMATTILSILPVIVIYLFLQKYIVSSIALSGVKQ